MRLLFLCEIWLGMVWGGVCADCSLRVGWECLGQSLRWGDGDCGQRGWISGADHNAKKLYHEIVDRIQQTIDNKKFDHREFVGIGRGKAKLADKELV